MRRLAALALVLALWPATALAAAPKTSLPDVEDEVMCVECGTALNVSQAPSADRERAFIRRRIAEGKTKDQIKKELVAQYGPNVLGTPPDKGFDIAVWLVPLLLAVTAFGVVATTARRWRRASRPAAAPAPADGGGDRSLAPEDARRLESDMASYDL